jgi:hypothetical protein
MGFLRRKLIYIRMCKWFWVHVFAWNFVTTFKFLIKIKNRIFAFRIWIFFWYSIFFPKFSTLMDNTIPFWRYVSISYFSIPLSIPQPFSFSFFLNLRNLFRNRQVSTGYWKNIIFKQNCCCCSTTSTTSTIKNRMISAFCRCILP